MLPFGLLTVVFTVRIGWYWLVEDYSALDAVYQTVITLSTVGYEEIHPLDNSGRVFTIVFILTGIGLMFYTATALVELVVTGEIRDMLGRRHSERRVRCMENHVIVCGYGRVGQEIAHELAEHHVEHVVVDQRAEVLEQAKEAGSAVTHGDAIEEPVL
jgi:voltage-gated potassium channel